MRPMIECMSRRLRCQLWIGGVPRLRRANRPRRARSVERTRARQQANIDDVALSVGRLWLLLGERLEEFLSAEIHFLLRQVFLPCGDRPAVSVRIDKRAHAIAPELI